MEHKTYIAFIELKQVGGVAKFIELATRLLGRVNKEELYSPSLNKTFPPETLLCGPMELTIAQEPVPYGPMGLKILPGKSGVMVIILSYKNNGSEELSKGWNHFPTLNTGEVIETFEPIYEPVIFDKQFFQKLLLIDISQIGK